MRIKEFVWTFFDAWKTWRVFHFIGIEFTMIKVIREILWNEG